MTGKVYQLRTMENRAELLSKIMTRIIYQLIRSPGIALRSTVLEAALPW